MTRNGGALLLRQADCRPGLTAAVAGRLVDPRQRGKLRHSVVDMVRQRVFGIAPGYEDLNDPADLRMTLVCSGQCPDAVPLREPGRSGVGVGDPRGSGGDLHRRRRRRSCWTSMRPTMRCPEIGRSDQEGRFFHGDHDGCCFLPLHVFCGDHLLVACLRPADIDPAKHSPGILKLLVGHLRRAWPPFVPWGVRIVVRADSGFCPQRSRDRLMRWCARHDVGDILGLARNARLAALAAPAMALAEADFAESGAKQRRFADLGYGARSWDRMRRVIARIAHGPRGANPRFQPGGRRPRALRGSLLRRARGERENRIREQQRQLFADRTACHGWWPNPFRLLRAGLACTLINAIRRLRLQGTRMVRAQGATIPPEDRRRDHPQSPAGALPPVVGLPRPGPLPSHRRTARTRMAPNPRAGQVRSTPEARTETPARARTPKNPSRTAR